MSHRESPTPASTDRVGVRLAYAAAAWAFAHAALSLYWMLGGTAGLALLSDGIQREAAAREPYFVALLAAVIVLKVGAGCIALALVGSEARRMPRWLRLLAGWGTGAVMTAYAVLGLGLGALARFGVLPVAGEPDPAAIWYLVLWYPLWLLGGVLFLAATWRATVWGRSRGHRPEVNDPNSHAARPRG